MLEQNVKNVNRSIDQKKGERHTTTAHDANKKTLSKRKWEKREQRRMWESSVFEGTKEGKPGPRRLWDKNFVDSGEEQNLEKSWGNPLLHSGGRTEGIAVKEQGGGGGQEFAVPKKPRSQVRYQREGGVFSPAEPQGKSPPPSPEPRI